MNKNKKRNIKLRYKTVPKLLEDFGRQRVPWINLCGLWLQEAGFEIGETLEISVEKHAILISKKNAP